MCNASVHHHPLHIISMAVGIYRRRWPLLSSGSPAKGLSCCLKSLRIKLNFAGLMGYFNLHKNIWTLVVPWQWLIIECVFTWDLALKTRCESLGAKHTFEAHTCQLWAGDNGMESQRLKVVHVLCFVNCATGREYLPTLFKCETRKCINKTFTTQYRLLTTFSKKDLKWIPSLAFKSSKSSHK